MSGVPSRSRTRPGSPRLKEYCPRAGAPDRAYGAATSRDAGADRLAERDAEETLFTIPNRTFAWHDLMASDHVVSETLLHQPPGVSAASTQSSCSVDAPDCHVGRSDSGSVAGFRGRHGIDRPCCLLAHRVGERPISISLGSLVSHRHVGSRMTETSHQFFGRCALPGGERGGHTSKPMKGEALQAEGRDGRPPNISPEIGRGKNAASRSHEDQTVRPWLHDHLPFGSGSDGLAWVVVRLGLTRLGLFGLHRGCQRRLRRPADSLRSPLTAAPATKRWAGIG